MSYTGSYLAHEINSAQRNVEYDQHAKRLLKDKGVLASILINTVPEFQGYTLEEAKAAIEGEPEVASIPVRPTSPEAIKGDFNESSLPGEGVITFDIVFWAVTKEGEHTKLYINIEAQKDFYPGYDLVTRGIVYGARLISHQMDVEFTPKDYSGVKKVYSIWICMNAPTRNNEGSDVSDSIIEYSISPKVRYQSDGRSVDVEHWRYDLMSVIFICLGRDTLDSENRIIGMLSTLLSDELDVKEKKDLLENKFNLPMSKDMLEEARVMCNISEAIAAEEKAENEALRVEIATKDTVIAEMDAALKEALAEIERLKARK